MSFTAIRAIDKIFMDTGLRFLWYSFMYLVDVEILQLTKHLKALKIMDSWSLRKGGEKG